MDCQKIWKDSAVTDLWQMLTLSCCVLQVSFGEHELCDHEVSGDCGQETGADYVGKFSRFYYVTVISESTLKVFVCLSVCLSFLIYWSSFCLYPRQAVIFSFCLPVFVAVCLYLLTCLSWSICLSAYLPLFDCLIFTYSPTYLSLCTLYRQLLLVFVCPSVCLHLSVSICLFLQTDSTTCLICL